MRSLIAGGWGRCEHGFGSVVSLSVVELSSVMCGHKEDLLAGGREQCEHGPGSVDADPVEVWGSTTLGISH